MKIKKLYLQKFVFIFSMVIFSVVFSISNAQHMFFHLLPGFGTPFTWVGLGGDANWTTTSNWSNNAVPAATDTATFDDSCVSNCNPLINASISVARINMKSTYAGTITQNSGRTITIGNGGWTQAGGNFVGGDAAIQVNGVTVISAGTFTSTSAVLEFKNAVTMTGASFVHASGTVDLNLNCQIVDFNLGMKTLDKFRILGQCGVVNLQGSIITVLSGFELRDTNGGILNNGTIEAQGDVQLGSYGSTGTAWVKLTGGNAQTINNADINQDRPSLPHFEIAKNVGTVATFNGQINLTRDYIYTSGNMAMGTSNWVLKQDCSIRNIHPGNWNYPNVTLSHDCGTLDLGAGTFKVTGTLTLASTFVGKFANGTIEAYGDITQTGAHGLQDALPATGLLKVVGAGNQTITGGAGLFPKMEIASTGGTVSLVGTINLMSDYTHSTGAVNAGVSTLAFVGNGTITPAAINYYNVTFAGDNKTQNLNAGTLNVTNTLTLADTNAASGNVNNGTIAASGNVVFSSFGKLGSALLSYTGTASTTLTIAATAQTLSTTHNVAKTGVGTVALVANTSFASAGRNFTVTSGTFNVAGYTFSVNSLITVSANGRLLCNGGTATAGSWAITGQISCGTGQGITWTGAGGDNLWSTASNWTNNTVPGASDVALFNASVCIGAACNAQINSNLSVRGITLQSTYTGTLTQNATRTLTIGTGGYTQAGGTFAGGDSTMNVNSAFNLSSGTFTATSGSWGQWTSFVSTGAPIFNHNSGTFVMNDVVAITPNGLTFNNVTTSGCSSTVTTTGTMIVIGSLNLQASCGAGVFNGGTYEARGNVVSSNNGAYGTTVILINGAGAQSLSGATSYLPAININKGGGTLTVTGTSRVFGSWTYTAGTVDASTSTINFENSNSIVPGSVNYNNINFAGCGGSMNLNTNTMIVVGTVGFAFGCGGGNVNSGTIEARGNIASSNSGSWGTAVVLINGAAAQSMSGVSSWVPAVNINKPSGTLTLSGTIRTASAWTYTAGTVDAGTSNISFESGNSIIPGSIIYYQASFAGCGGSMNLNAGTMIVSNTLNIGFGCGGGNINNGTIEARGDITSTNSGGWGTAVILINGTAAQAMSGATTYVPAININKVSGTLTLSGTIRISSGWTYVAGTVDAGTSTIQFEGSNSVIPGAMIFNNITFAGCGGTMNFNAGTLVTTGTMTLNYGCAPGDLNNGTIESRGHTIISGNGANGTATFNFNGTTSGNFTWTTGSFMTTTVNVLKTGAGSVVLASNIAFSTAGRNLNVTSGTLDLAGYDLTINNILTIGAAGILKCNGGEFTAGTLTNSGTVNCPGYATYDFNWTGAGGNANWTTAGNWQGGVAPGASDIVVFQDTYCGATCNSTISVNQNAKGVRIFSPYTGTITQNNSAQLFVGSRGYTQAAGTFQGGNDSLSVTTKFMLTGGVFNSTSGFFGFAGSTWTTASGTFNPGSGTVQIDGPIGGTGTINHGTNTFNQLNLYGWASSYTTTGTIIVNGDFNFGTGSGSSTNLTGGIIEVKGNTTMVSFGLGTSLATTLLRLNGTGTQTLAGSGGTMPNLEINKSSGTLTLTGSMNLNGTLNYVAGTVAAGASTVVFQSVSALRTHSPNGLTLANVTFDFLNTTSTTSLNNQTLNTTGTVIFKSSLAGSSLNAGTITIAGDSVKSGTNSVGGTVAIEYVGSTNKTITPSGTTAFPGSTTINKSGGAKVSLIGNSYFNNAGQNLTIAAGTLDMAGFNLTVGNNISNSGILQRGNNPTCGVVSQGGSFTGNAAVCP